MSDFKKEVSRLNAEYGALERQFSSGNCWRLSTTMQELEGALREHIQTITRDEIAQIIQKLETKEQLDKHEIDYIKLWIIGDAEYYIQLENNYNDWVGELNRLVGEINKVDVSRTDFHTAAKLRAMLHDGIRVIGDIMFFIKQKERIINFTESTKDIDPQERDLLIQLLKGKIAASPSA